MRKRRGLTLAHFTRVGYRLSAKWQQCGSNRAQDTAEPIRKHVETKAAFWLI